ncbi:MFS transporter [Haladaptatus halobius]|uniref:MFS transporter n=1 Tax=Haladaptatus halobius TaxID=2884875 RepID=UPI001D0B901C|nr:MFS transporter [Haladaptatus halobius]
MRLPDSPPPLVLKYYLYQATVTFGFFWPVFTVFLLHRGLSYTQIGLLGTISAAFVVLGELPTGYVGDRIGRRNGLLVGFVLLSLSLLGFVVARGFAGFVVLYVLWALGLVFHSGSDDAWLYDALESRLREDEYTRIRGRGGSVNQWVSAGTMLAAGGLYGVRPWLPFLAGGLLVACSIPVLISMPRSKHTDEEDGLTVVETFPLIRQRLTEPPLRLFVLYVALFYGIVNAADTFIQPIATWTLGLPMAGLGPLYTGFTVVAAVASYHAGTIEELLSTRWAVLLIPGLVATFFVVPLLAPLAALPLFFTMKSARVVMAPITSGYLNDCVESVGRATLLSAASMVYALVRLPLKPLAGVVADATAPLVAVAALGGFFVLASVVVCAVETPVADAKTERQTAD